MSNILKAVAASAATAALSACASSPKNIEAAYVSPIKYQAFTCDQLAIERTAVEYRANILYHSLRKRAKGDAVKMGLGSTIFLPALFFIKGNGTKAAEFAQLKGDYQALRITSEDRGCNIVFPDLEKAAAAKSVQAELVVDETIS
ncbi:MAG TPA: hypothetical protein VGD10_09495 [Allosphingosinicella sp.]|uniref:hypothetical protein n=1 Tax=Allosphingosinicella sp. TaxID=2823234 RepID=UPI002ED871A8